MGRRHKFASAEHRRAFQAPELEGFRKWVRERGYRAYQRYLLTHLGDTSREALAELPKQLRADFKRSFRGRAQSAFDVLAQRLDELFASLSPRSPPRAIVLLAGVAGLGWLLRRFSLGFLAELVLLCLVAALTQAYVSFHGDAMETARHGLLVGVLFRLGIVGSATIAVGFGAGLASRALASRAREPATSA